MKSFINKHENHGGNVPNDFLDFSISVNPYKPPFIDALFETAKQQSGQYPYYEELDEELSALNGFESILTAGTTESLYLLFMAFNGRVVVPQYAYGEYTRTAHLFKRIVIRSEQPGKVAKSGDLVFFCNPESPKGIFHPEQEIRDFVNTCLSKNAIPIIDDAFVDFVEDHKPRIYDGAIHLRTYTKVYGLPGIRVGFFFDPYGEMKKNRMPWSLGGIGKSFIRHVLDDQFEFPKQTLPRLWQEKKRIAKRLKINTDANFFCMTVPELPLLKSRLFQEKIAVRDCASFGLESSIRFCIGKEEDNNRLLQVLENHVEGVKKRRFHSKG